MTAELTPDNNGRAEIVLLYPNRTRLTITGDYEVVRQIVQRLDGLEIIYRVDDTPGDHEHDFRCTQCGVECRGDIQAEIKRQVAEARLDELHKIKRLAEVHITARMVVSAHDEIGKDHRLAMVPVVYIDEIIADLQQEQEVNYGK